MKFIKLMILSMAVLGLVFSCKPSKTEQTKTPGYGEPEAPGYGQ